MLVKQSGEKYTYEVALNIAGAPGLWENSSGLAPCATTVETGMELDGFGPSRNKRSQDLV